MWRKLKKRGGTKKKGVEKKGTGKNGGGRRKIQKKTEGEKLRKIPKRGGRRGNPLEKDQ